MRQMPEQQPSPPPEDPPLSPEESLTLIKAGQTDQVRRRSLNAALLFAVWGVTYLISFGAWYLARQHVLPMLAAEVPTVVLFVGSLIFSSWHGPHSSQGVRGPSQVVGAMYGISWPISYFALAAVNVGLERTGLTEDQVTLLWSGTTLLLAGALYLAGGAVFHSWPYYAMGGWTMIAAAGSVLAGIPGNFLVLSLAGGGGFLAQAAYYAWRRSRPSDPDHVCTGPVGMDVPAL